MKLKAPATGISEIFQYLVSALIMGTIVVILTPGGEDSSDERSTQRNSRERSQRISDSQFGRSLSRGGPERLMIMQEEPSRVMDHIDGLVDRDQALELAKIFASEYGGRHLDLLIAWLRRQHDPAIRSELTSLLAFRWARQDSRELTEFALTLGSDPRSRTAREAVLHAINCSEAVVLLKQLPPDEAASLVGKDHKRLAVTAPDEAVAILDSAPVTEESLAAMELLIASWVRGDKIRWFGDPVSAAGRVSKIQSNDLRQDAYESLASNWCRTSPSLAASWVGSLPHGQERDSAIVGLVGRLALSDAEAAGKWVGEIEDMEMRKSAEGQVAEIEKEAEN